MPGRLDLFEQAQRVNVGDDLLARFEAIESAISRGSCVVQLAEGIEHIDFFETMTLSDFEVVEVVRRCDLDRAGALLGIGIFVRDDRNLAADERQLHLRAGFDERRITLILGMHCNARVAQHCLRPRRCNDDVVLVVAGQLSSSADSGNSTCAR